MQRKTLQQVIIYAILLVLPCGSSGVASDPKEPLWDEIHTRNETARQALDWTFGGKMQKGWYLYQPLIEKTLGVESVGNSREFVQSLMRWQRQAGVPVNGVLNQTTLLKMVEQWQLRRSKDRTIPQPERLLSVGGQDFWDPERPADLRQVERETFAAYKKMVRAAAQDLKLSVDGAGNLSATEKYLKIISAFRSPEYQQKLRELSPNSGRAGLAINSPHFTGRALDLYVGGDPVSTKDTNRAIQTNTKVYRWLVKNAGRFGFIPYFYEPWHWEYHPRAAE